MFKALRELLRQIRQFSDMIGIDLRELADIGRSLVALRAPPAITDGVLLRDWLRDLLAILVDIAEETPTAIDDSSLDILGALLENDSAWALAHKVMVLMVPRAVTAEEQVTKTAACIDISDLLNDTDRTVGPLGSRLIDTVLEATVDIVTLLTPPETKEKK